MRLTGTLRTWNDDRGFGFIAPTHGGAELFVHISSLPKDGTRPTVGEKLTYELGSGKNGQPQAMNVQREAVGRHAVGRLARSEPVKRNPPGGWRMLGVGLLLVLAFVGIDRYRKQAAASSQAPSIVSSTDAAAVVPDGVPSFKCDGRVHCSQMTSCAEAKYFLKNCPGTKMDGNNDGVPCEQQWCTSPFAK